MLDLRLGSATATYGAGRRPADPVRSEMRGTDCPQNLGIRLPGATDSKHPETYITVLTCYLLLGVPHTDTGPHNSTLDSVSNANVSATQPPLNRKVPRSFFIHLSHARGLHSCKPCCDMSQSHHLVRRYCPPDCLFTLPVHIPSISPMQKHPKQISRACLEHRLSTHTNLAVWISKQNPASFKAPSCLRSYWTSTTTYHSTKSRQKCRRLHHPLQ